MQCGMGAVPVADTVIKPGQAEQASDLRTECEIEAHAEMRRSSWRMELSTLPTPIVAGT